jgi:hypothetical protein
MLQAAFLPLVLVLGWISGGEEAAIDRGTYYRDQEHAFELWIPRGFRERKPDPGEIGYFSGGSDGGHAIVMQVADWSSIRQFIQRRKEGAGTLFPGCEIEVFEGLEGAGRPAAMIWYRNLDETETWKGRELVTAAVELADRGVMEIDIQLEKGRAKCALAEARSLVASFKWTGERGLDPYLGERILQLDSGLSYRLPRGFVAGPVEGGKPLVVAASESGAIRLTLERADDSDVNRALHAAGSHRLRRGHSWEFPHAAGTNARGAVYRVEPEGPIERVRVVVAVKPPTGPVVVLALVGAETGEARLVRMAELVGLGLGHVDVKAAHERAAVEVGGLAAALREQDAPKAARCIEALAGLTFLPEARAALCTALAELREPDPLVRAAEALGQAGEADAFDALFEAARIARLRKQWRLLAALTAALGRVRDPKAISLLLSNAKRAEDAVRAAAIRALGQYRGHENKILRPLVRLMEKDEAAGRKPDLEAREQWLVLKPAYLDALENLTGKRFGTAAEARTWIEGHR